MSRLPRLLFSVLLLAFYAAAPAAAYTPTFVNNNAQLQAASTITYPGGLCRATFGNGNGAPTLCFGPSPVACTVNGGAGDGGSQVPSADGKCWIAVFPDALLDVRQFGAAAGSSSDQCPPIQAAINAAAVANATVLIPPGTYTGRSNTPDASYPLVVGPHCLTLNNVNNVRILGNGAVLTLATGFNNANIFSVVKSTNFEISGLRFLANLTGVGGFPSAIQIQYVSNFYIHDLYWDGVWGPSSGASIGIAGSGISDGTIARLNGQNMAICTDMAFVQRVTITGINMRGAGGSNPSGFGCINFLHDAPTYAYYPGVWPDYTTHDITLTNNNITYFGAGMSIRAGRRFNISNNNLFDNIGPEVGPPFTGAGVFIDFEVNGKDDSVNDPPSSFTINGNVMKNNGNTTNQGGGVVFSNEKISTSSQAVATTTLASGGTAYAVNDMLTAAGGTCTQQPTVIVNSVGGGGTVSTYTTYSRGMCTVIPANPISYTGGAGSGFTTNNTWAAPAPMSGFAISGNVFENNEPLAIGATASNNYIQNVAIGQNALIPGPDQAPTLPYNPYIIAVTQAMVAQFTFPTMLKSPPSSCTTPNVLVSGSLIADATTHAVSVCP